MEILFNLIWAAVILALWVLSGRSGGGVRRCQIRTSLRPAIGVRLIALAMLSAILLPVISITDDLQASHNPAEVQRSGDRSDRHSSVGSSTHRLPAALAHFELCVRPQQLHTIAFLTVDDAMPRQHIAFSQKLWSRPPPIA